MERVMNLYKKLNRRMMKLRLRPIRVFVFHQVSDVYNPLTMWKCDWTDTNRFKHFVMSLRDKGYRFVSLPEAWRHLQYDKIRRHKYVVLTCDDGYLSVLNILPWLEQQHIPITLFVNAKYLDKKSWSPINEEQARKAQVDVNMQDVVDNLYLSEEQLFKMTNPLVSIGVHGYEHLDALLMDEISFRDNVLRCVNALKSHPCFVPFHAYTWGHHSAETDRCLSSMGLVPVLVDGMKNYRETCFIHREVF